MLALRHNPVRSMLTALGMVIGTASVILVVTISLTSQTYILDQIEGVGSNMIFASYEIGTNRPPPKSVPTSSNRATFRPSASNWPPKSPPPPG